MKELLNKGITEEDILFRLVKLYACQEHINISGKIIDKKLRKIHATFDTNKNEIIKK